MVQFKSITLITAIGLVILFSGCVGNQTGTPTPTPTETSTPIMTSTPTVTSTPTAMVTTPQPIATTPSVLLYGALYVDARMKKLSTWGNGTYEFTSLQAKITDVINIPISIKAQIVSDGQILEENSFTLESGSSYTLANKGSHLINSTNVSLWLLAEGYQPTEYKITTIYS